MKNVFSKPAHAGTDLYQRKWVVGSVVGLLLLALFLLPGLGGAGDAVSSKLLREKFPDTFRIAVIADLDKSSKVKDKNLYRAPYMTGTLKRTGERYSLEWDAPVDLVTSHNEAGRGAELSELVRYQGALYTFDDRTGIMFEVINPEDSAARKPAKPEAYIAPRHIFMEGDGSTDKGMKVEWATVKDGLLYVGSFGKEFTNNEGGIIHANNLWVVVVDKDGKMMHADWREQYTAMRKALGYEHPAYLLHETVMWSPHHKQWFVLPRRMSKDAYDENADERMGANTIITASSDFKSIKAYTVGEISPLRGFSSAKFLPGSRDTVIIALKSEENSERKRQTAYFTVFGQNEDGSGWRVLLDEVEIPGEAKMEGLEVLSWGTGSA